MPSVARQLDEEQDVEALQEERVDGEEVALQDAPRLLTEELPPALLEPPRCRLDLRLLEDRPDRARGEFPCRTPPRACRLLTQPSPRVSDGEDGAVLSTMTASRSLATSRTAGADESTCKSTPYRL